IDKKKRIDTPLRCAEYVPRAIGRLFDRPISGINLSTVSMDTYIDYKYVNTILSPGFMLDRPVFIKSLVTDFKDNGGKFMPGTKAVSFHRDNTAGIISTVLQGAGGEKSIVRSKIVVGADGPNSIVGKYIGSTNSGYILGLGENIPVVAKDKNKTLVFFSPEIEGGYGWIFPKEENTNLGIGCQFAGDRKNINLVLKKIYKDFKKKVFLMDIFNLSGSSARLSPPVEASFTAGLIPVSGMNKKTVSGSFILAGDAAGLTNPITGAGIYNAVNSSKIISGIIAEALKNSDMELLRDIEKQYLDTFGRSLQRAAFKREELMNKWQENSDPGIDDSGSFDRLTRLCWVSFKDYWEVSLKIDGSMLSYSEFRNR
ncbi:MAG: NAD(P)/FAD-dependent oxidoreductase, partial [Candidatus Humimicrobiaceae bacterium]